MPKRKKSESRAKKASTKPRASKRSPKTPISVPPQKAFYFYRDIGAPMGKSASSLKEFSHQLETIDAESIEFHTKRGDFENWVKDIFRNNKLAKRLKTIKTLGLRGEQLRKVVHEEVQRNMLIYPR